AVSRGAEPTRLTVVRLYSCCHFPPWAGGCHRLRELLVEFLQQGAADAVALLTATAFPYVCSWSARQKLGDSRRKGGQAVRGPRPAVQYHLVIFGTDATIWPSLLGLHR